MRIGPVVIERHGRGERRSLEEILSETNMVEVTDDAVIVSMQESPKTTEIGSTSTKFRRVLGGEEYNPTLQGIAGIEKYDEMRRSDSTVRQSLRIAKVPVLAGGWYVDPADATDTLAVEQAKFIEKALFEFPSHGWMQFLTESLLCLDFGYYFFEKVFENREVDGESRWVWKKFASRHPLDVVEWEFDDSGGPNGVIMNDFDGTSEVFIPIEKLLVFTYDQEAGNIEGISILRSAYANWYYKTNLYKIDAIQKERHGIGIPVIKLPPNWNETDRILAGQMGKNLRTNEQAHIVLPPGWEVEFAEVKGNPVNAIESAAHHDDQILRNVLADFLSANHSTAAEIRADLFLKASRFIADIVADVINKFAIPELIDFNWEDTTSYPKLKVRRIGETADWRTLTFALRNLVGAGLITPDDKYEEWLREEMDQPRRDEGTSRDTATPQLPRQSQARNQQQQPGSGAGADSSGG